MVLPFARAVAPTLAVRLGGPGRVAVLGCLVTAGGMTLWLTQMQAQTAYLTTFLPAQLLGGAGFGLAIPSLLSAGSMALPSDKFGTGSGILNMARQIGTVLGVAALVAILAQVGPDTVERLRHGVVLVISFLVEADLVAAILLTRRVNVPRTPAVAPASAQSTATSDCMPSTTPSSGMCKPT